MREGREDSFRRDPGDYLGGNEHAWFGGCFYRKKKLWLQCSRTLTQEVFNDLEPLKPFKS